MNLLLMIMICTCACSAVMFFYMRSTRMEHTMEIAQAQDSKDSSSFPQYDGMDARKILVELNANYPQYNVEIVAPGFPVTTDYREDRVRLFTNRSGKVLRSVIG